MTTTCPKCNGRMEPGHATALAPMWHAPGPARASQVLFVVPGAPTSLNPIKAFKQGLADEPTDRAYRISGARCSTCGFLEFYAAEVVPNP